MLPPSKIMETQQTRYVRLIVAEVGESPNGPAVSLNRFLKSMISKLLKKHSPVAKTLSIYRNPRVID